MPDTRYLTTVTVEVLSDDPLQDPVTPLLVARLARGIDDGTVDGRVVASPSRPATVAEMERIYDA